MSKFAPEWLTLREDADARARNRDVAAAMEARFQLRESINVIDLGCGAGANLRATASRLPLQQRWTLIDNDAALIDRAKIELASWADGVVVRGEAYELTKGPLVIEATFRTADLSRQLDDVLAPGADLVTASALFDLVSVDFIRLLATRLADMGSAFYGALTYNGVQRWTPHRPTDNQISAAFHRHQLGDKGFGPAAGPMAPAHLADQFRINGYVVTEGDSPWRLGRGDRLLIAELVAGHAVAVGETGLVDSRTIEQWVAVSRTGAETGHTDIFAAPP